MKARTVRSMSVVLSLILASSWIAFAATTKKKQVPAICKDLPDSDKPVVAVADFVVKTDVSPQVGHGMATMLANALQNTGCFQVVERERLGDVLAEQSLGQSGAVEEETAPEVGKLTGARFQFLGEITAFSDSVAGGKVGAAFLDLFRFRGRARAAAGELEARVAQVNFSIRIVNPANGKLVESGEWKTNRTSVGLAGSEASAGWASGFQSIGAAGFKSQAIADAVSDGIIQASAELAQSGHTKMLAQIRGAQEATPGAPSRKVTPARR